METARQTEEPLRPTLFRPDRVVGGVANIERVKLATTALAAYGRETKSTGNGLFTLMADLLSDFFHLAEACGHRIREVDAALVAERAYRYFRDESTGEPDENPEVSTYLEEPLYDDFSDRSGFLEAVPSYFMVCGRVLGSDDDTAAVVEVMPGEDPSRVFVEEHLGYRIYSREDWAAFKEEEGFFPADGLPEDWHERDPEDDESCKYEEGCWGAHVHTVEELYGPALKR